MAKKSPAKAKNENGATKVRKPRATSELGTLKQRLADIDAERSEVASAIELIEKLLGKSTGHRGRPAGSTNKATRTTSGTRKGKPTLEVVFRDVLSKHKKGITIEDACDAVKKAGYETNSSDFLKVMQQLVHKMMHNKDLKVVGEDGRKNLYAAVA